VNGSAIKFLAITRELARETINKQTTMKTKHTPGHGSHGSLTISESHFGGMRRPLKNPGVSFIGRVAAILSAAALLGDTATASTVISSEDLLQESMMHSISTTMMIVTTDIPPDAFTTLSFTSSVNFLANTFSYSALPDQMYNGQPFSLQAAGTFDMVSQLAICTTSGMVTNKTLTDLANIKWKDDKPETMEGVITGTTKVDNDTYTFEGNVILTATGKPSTDSVHSSGTVSFKGKGPLNSGTRSVEDFYKRNSSGIGGKWVISTSDGKKLTSIDGTGPDSSGNGTFIVSVPEPSYSALSGTLALAFALSARAAARGLSWPFPARDGACVRPAMAGTWRRPRRPSRRSRHPAGARAAVGDLRTEAAAMFSRRPACGRQGTHE
jgi:hypothetical protein